MRVTLMHGCGRLAAVQAVLIFGSFVIATASFAGSDDSTLSVVVDQAKILKLPERVSTIVVGNPLIADVTLQPGGMVVVTGKGYGSTNMIAMDKSAAAFLPIARSRFQVRRINS